MTSCGLAPSTCSEKTFTVSFKPSTIAFLCLATPKIMMMIYLKTVFAELQSKINFLARNKIYIVKIYNDTRDNDGNYDVGGGGGDDNNDDDNDDYKDDDDNDDDGDGGGDDDDDDEDDDNKDDDGGDDNDDYNDDDNKDDDGDGGGDDDDNGDDNKDDDGDGGGDDDDNGDDDNEFLPKPDRYLDSASASAALTCKIFSASAFSA
jgi:hypothetical protein